ncbi:dolichyl-phosphate beta-glucosyltransferase [Actinomortierella ambigua]|uniref:dolichyl-phosphate beta-glucosyltransferase n=1 Tax=Actinomortierella ambigua TaxID=1343610 RepID=A0A9P6QJ35_9FUNG|nr:dolichyl-phosphate beta-glucosyltransferase [Actinomortierella ambigua]
MLSWAVILSSLVLGGIAAVITFLVLWSPRPRQATELERRYQDHSMIEALLEDDKEAARKKKQEEDAPESATSSTPAPKKQRRWRSKAYTSLLKPLQRTDENDAERSLTLVVPAYNESERLPIMLKETLAHLKERSQRPSISGQPFTYEILLVDDGSRDDTVKVALEWAQQEKQADLRVLTLERNRGKGGAVIQGMLHARGEYLLMVDADGATKFSDLDRLEQEMKRVEKSGLGVAIGSRAHLVKTDAVVKRSFIRNFLMYSFHLIVHILGIRGIADTQCGFKLFSRKAAQAIFPNMHVEGWVFDIEVLMMAQQLGIPIVEVPVAWQEIDGSKVSLVRDSIKMALDLLVIRLNYILGLWTVPRLPTSSSSKSAPAE